MLSWANRWLQDAVPYGCAAPHRDVFVIRRAVSQLEVMLPQIFLDLRIKLLSYLHGISFIIEMRVSHRCP